MRPRQTTCRSCGAAIFWALTDEDKKLPVDAKPVARGNVYLTLRRSTGQLYAEVLGEPVERDERNVYVSHWATCPHADDWRSR